jgi:hypothetical protein
MEISRRQVLAGAVVSLAGATAGPCWAQGNVLTPEMFGAKGDGVTNDADAFAEMSRALNARGGGVIRLRPVLYRIGVQRRALGPRQGWAFTPMPVIEARECSRPVAIEGNGARIKCVDGLLYGTFDRVTGRPTKHQQPYYDQQDIATPYTYMILVEKCSGPVSISDLELDGNLQRLKIGGPYGDTGWQIPAVGIFLRDNRGDEIVRNVYSHHHAQDGIMIDGLDEPALAARVTRVVENLRAEYNGRQGCSLVGGRGYVFRRCKFNHTAKAGLHSAPAAGFDIEAEGSKKNREHHFEDCEFVDNGGCGLLAEAGDNEGATFTSCRFVGSTNWSAWPFAPRMRFDKCTFVGAVVKVYGDKDPRRASQFYDCTFLDDPKLSPTGTVFLPQKPHGAIVDNNFAVNALYSRCRFRLTHDGLLPWGWRAIYENCTMEQKASTTSFPKGEYRGFNTIKGAVDMYNTKVTGVLVLNGQRYQKMRFGGEPW